MGYLQPSDPIVMNIHELLFTAITWVRNLSAVGYRPPLAGLFAVAGSSVCATLQAQVLNLREGGFVSEHDALLANSIATVLCGGGLAAGTLVDEAWLLRLEREHFVNLLQTSKTQQRLMGMLQTGKPVRN
jgi:3-hydroxyacyl-CoA dehydrogenase